MTHTDKLREMTPAEQCKAHGLKSLLELSRISGVSVRTLDHWANHKPKLFELLIIGAKHATICLYPA